MKTIIYDPEITGHHLEYVNNLFIACGKDKSKEYIFVIPSIQIKTGEYNWPEYSNCSFRFLSSEELNSIKGGILSRCYKESVLLRNIVKELSCDEIILLNLSPVIPCLPFFIPSGIKIKGILYQIYLWNEKKDLHHIIEALRYKVLAYHKQISKIYLLNDEKNPDILNDKFKSTKFTYLPDPLPIITTDKIDIRKELKIPTTNIVFLHFGAMDRRKGTLDILKALKLIPPYLKHTYIFAGKVNKDIESEVSRILNEISSRHHVIFINDFCSYSFLYSLCEISSAILMPYHRTSQSSGLLGHASFNNIPVIGPSSGLIGELIRNNRLGQTLTEVSPQSIAQAIIDFTPCRISDNYAKKNSIQKFQNLILSEQ